MKELFITNKSDLKKILSNINIKTSGLRVRSKEYRETWSICHWLSTYPSLVYPIRLVHRNKPDFYIKLGDQECGIEVTDAIPKDFAHARAIREKKNQGTFLDMSLFRWNQKKTPQEIHEIVSRSKLTGLGWEGKSPEIEWGVALAEIIKDKTGLLRGKDWKIFSKNYLLIYENLTLPRVNFDYSYACALLGDSLKSYWCSGLVFDIIFVQRDNILIRFDSSTFEILKTVKFGD